MVDPWWISFMAGGLFGSGAVWSFLNYRQRAKEVELSSALSISKLQKDLADKLLELIARSEEYSGIRDGKSRQTFLTTSYFSSMRTSKFYKATYELAKYA